METGVATGCAKSTPTLGTFQTLPLVCGASATRSRPVATTVTRTSSPISSLRAEPKMTVACEVEKVLRMSMASRISARVRDSSPVK